MTQKNNIPENLCAYTIPLTGKHLIEASAGTGKTYNITRLYLRLLLEKKLTVEQILVMTFTKDATEELRGRIDTSIREALNKWAELVEKDEFFQAIGEKITHEEALYLLKRALLTLDEAAIFTIHGFCSRVLTQHAFSTGMTFNAQMEADCQTLLLESIQDWYRYLAKTSTTSYELLISLGTQNELTPDQFYDQFSRAIGMQANITTVSEQEIKDNFLMLVEDAQASLLNHKDFLFEYLVEVKKGTERQKRIDEFEQLLAWLTALKNDIAHAETAMPISFFDGRRFSKSPEKEVLKAIFLPLDNIKKSYSKLHENLKKAKAYQIVIQGIANIRQRFTAKKQLQNIVNFDDLISSLAEALVANKQLAQQLYNQFPVALVDEFQDTDPQQFNILQAIYSDENLAEQAEVNRPQQDNLTVNNSGALYLIGDPKQAIYAFRGGDVFAYLMARDYCQYQWLMDTNWRSNKQLIAGYNRLFWGNELHKPAEDVFSYRIDYTPVKACAVADKFTEVDQQFKPLHFVHFSSNAELEEGKKEANAPFRSVMAKWCAQEIHRLLEQKSNHSTNSHTTAHSTSYAILAAKDIAILVRDGTEAKEIKQALNNAGLSAVYLSDRENVLKSSQAQQLLIILKAIFEVENDRQFAMAMANPLMGLTPVAFYQLRQDHYAWQQKKLAFITLRELWQDKSFISMALRLLHQHFVIEEQQKDRTLTNLIHLFELLQSASQQHKQPQALIYWFEQQINLNELASEQQLRLESDEDLIKIVTQHGAKGLEYPVVFVPFASRHKDPLKVGNKNINVITYHDQQGKLCVSLAGNKANKQAMQDEAYAETVRLLYVAITRAKQRCYLLTAAFKGYENSPLGRTLKWQKGEDILTSLQQLTLENNASIGVTHLHENEVTHNQNISLIAPKIAEKQYQAAKLTTNVTSDWWLSSFTALTRNIHQAAISTPDRDNEFSLPSNDTVYSSALRFTMKKGAQTGNLLHLLLEKMDFSAPDWAFLKQHIFPRYSELITDEAALLTWLENILHCSLSEQVPFLANQADKNPLHLAMLTPQQTLREVEFYFPLQQSRVASLANILIAHRLQYKLDNSQLDHYQPLPVNLSNYQQLNGMMHGFIDLVFCHQGKYYVCDYKSSYLGDSFDDYNHRQMRYNIEENHYDLQYLIYSLALHRYLQLRVENYQSELHFGGVFYLYLRGMSSDKDKLGNGVYYRSISAQELTQLDQLFANGECAKQERKYSDAKEQGATDV